MNTLKKIAKALLFPHVAVVVLLVPVAMAMLIYSFAALDGDNIICYISYALSAYALTLISVRAPAIIRFFTAFKRENKYILRYTSDAKLRARLSLYSSLILNTVYAVFQLGLGVTHGSWWFYSLAAYYILLVLMRFFLLRDLRGLEDKDREDELRRYRFCGVVLLLMNLALALMVFFITYFNRGFEHHYITTIAMAAYTFASFSLAVVNIVKYRRYNSPVLSATKAINLAAACVSMLTLETAMFTAFGDQSDDTLRGTMTLLTGIAVCLFIMIMAVNMICHATKELKLSIEEKDKNG